MALTALLRQVQRRQPAAVAARAQQHFGSRATARLGQMRQGQSCRVMVHCPAAQQHWTWLLLAQLHWQPSLQQPPARWRNTRQMLQPRHLAVLVAAATAAVVQRWQLIHRSGRFAR